MTPRRLKHLLLVGAIGFAFLFAPTAAAAKQQAATPETESWPGAVARSVVTKAGRITVYLPQDMRAGDTISGSVLAEPAGKSPRERQRSSDTLEGAVIEIDGKQFVRAGRVIQFAVPATGLVALITKSADGKVLGRSILNVGPPAPAGAAIDVPRFGQAGRPLTIAGNFDGNAANTVARMGEIPVEIIAESPRGLVVRVPQDAVGPKALNVGETGNQRTVTLSTVAVGLSAAMHTLLKGETTRVTVQVDGLQGQRAAPAPQLVLVGSPAIRLEGGNAQSLPLAPGPDGRVVLERQITGLLPGGFEVSAQIMAQQAPIRMDPLFPDALDMNGIDSFKELLGLVASMNDDARAAMLRATLKALRQRHKDARDDDTREWLEEKIRIVEKTMDTLGVPR